jgi:hypothetical protein
MSVMKDFGIFWDNHGLDAKQQKTLDAYRRHRVGLPWEEEKGGECPECGKNSLKVTPGKRPYCFYCGPVGTIDGQAAIVLTPDQRKAEKKLIEEKRAEDLAWSLARWNESEPIGSNHTVAAYLGARRISLPPDGVMRWHQRCQFGTDKKPCIISLFRSALTDEPTGIHRTWIASAATGNSERRAKGVMAGSAIKLWPLTAGGEELAIGEGIENVLAAVQLEVCSPPAWAATVANNLSRLPVIPGIKRLIIAADNDQHGKGQEHARILRRKWLDKGRKVAAKIPEKVGWDFNDVLIRRQS